MADLPDILQVDDIDGGRYRIHMPSESAEGRDVVFSGQYLAQMIMAADRAHSSAKDVQVFSREGRFGQAWNTQRPSGISVDRREGLVFVSEMGVDEGSDLFARGQIGRSERPKVTIWTMDGEQIDEIRSATDDPTDPGSFILPHGIAVDSRGDLYIAETTTTYRRAREGAARSGQTTSFGAAVNCGPMPLGCHSLQKFRRRSGHEPRLGSWRPSDS